MEGAGALLSSFVSLNIVVLLGDRRPFFIVWEIIPHRPGCAGRDVRAPSGCIAFQSDYGKIAVSNARTESDGAVKRRYHEGINHRRYRIYWY